MPGQSIGPSSETEEVAERTPDLYICSDCGAFVTAETIAPTYRPGTLWRSSAGVAFVRWCAICDDRFQRSRFAETAERNPQTGRAYGPTSQRARFARTNQIQALRRAVALLWRRTHDPERYARGPAFEAWEMTYGAQMVGETL
jgi:hypothetical protein